MNRVIQTLVWDKLKMTQESKPLRDLKKKRAIDWIRVL